MLARSLSLIVLMALPWSSVQAENRSPQGLLDKPKSQTEEWLKVQREGYKASAKVQQATPQEVERSAKRWLDSFDHPIPEQFDSSTAGEISR